MQCVLYLKLKGLEGKDLKYFINAPEFNSKSFRSVSKDFA